MTNDELERLLRESQNMDPIVATQFLTKEYERRNDKDALKSLIENARIQATAWNDALKELEIAARERRPGDKGWVYVNDLFDNNPRRIAVRDTEMTGSLALSDMPYYARCAQDFKMRYGVWTSWVEFAYSDVKTCRENRTIVGECVVGQNSHRLYKVATGMYESEQKEHFQFLSHEIMGNLFYERIEKAIAHAERGGSKLNRICCYEIIQKIPHIFENPYTKVTMWRDDP